MVRPLRIEYPGAWYHVMNRGRRGEQVFLEEADYNSFLELLLESVELWNLRIAAYGQMPNYYHQSKILAPGRAEIKELVCRIYGVRNEDLLEPKRGSFNERRSVAIYLTRQLRGENLAEICRE